MSLYFEELSVILGLHSVQFGTERDEDLYSLFRIGRVLAPSILDASNSSFAFPDSRWLYILTPKPMLSIYSFFDLEIIL